MSNLVPVQGTELGIRPSIGDPASWLGLDLDAAVIALTPMVPGTRGGHFGDRVYNARRLHFANELKSPIDGRTYVVWHRCIES